MQLAAEVDSSQGCKWQKCITGGAYEMMTAINGTVEPHGAQDNGIMPYLFRNE
jgi:hypothetical protein